MRPGPVLPLCRAMAGIAAAVTSYAALADGTVGGHLDGTSDYVFRGVSQTRGAAAVQADLHYQTTGGWFTGAWASTVDLNPGRGATVELNAYAGRAWSLGGPWNARITGVQYAYPNDTGFLSYDYFELVASLSYEDRVGVTVSWSPNTSRFSPTYGFSNESHTISYEMVGQVPIVDHVSATASLGYYDLSRLFETGYTYGSLGLGGTYRNFRADLAWFATSDSAREMFGAETTGNRWSLTVTWWF
jgi:uncharacterized protein (TIGR02001 family)